MSEPNRVVVQYKVGDGRLRRDVYENGKNKVQEHDHTKDDGTMAWSPIVAVSTDGVESFEVEP